MMSQRGIEGHWQLEEPPQVFVQWCKRRERPAGNGPHLPLRQGDLGAGTGVQEPLACGGSVMRLGWPSYRPASGS